MKLTNLFNSFLCAVTLVVFSATTAFADNTTPAPTGTAPSNNAKTAKSDPKDMKEIAAPVVEKPANPLTFDLGLPVWGSAISGKVGVRGRLTNAQYISFSDIWNHLDYVIPGSVAVGYGKWGFLATGEFVKLTENLQTRDILFNSASVNYEQAFVDVNISYKVVETDKFTLAPFVGTRVEYLYLHGQANATKINPINRPFNNSVDTAWADPVLGLQLSYKICKPVSFIAKADVGGFGAASHITYEAFGGFQTQITRNLYANGGYRYLDTYYQNGGFTYDVAFQGPQITFGVNF